VWAPSCPIPQNAASSSLRRALLAAGMNSHVGGPFSSNQSAFVPHIRPFRAEPSRPSQLRMCHVVLSMRHTDMPAIQLSNLFVRAGMCPLIVSRLRPRKAHTICFLVPPIPARCTPRSPNTREQNSSIHMHSSLEAVYRHA
jgi:hypothetical protein